ncbi:MAG: hypothetical protein V1487_02265 [bacterium]
MRVTYKEDEYEMTMCERMLFKRGGLGKEEGWRAVLCSTENDGREPLYFPPVWDPAMGTRDELLLYLGASGVEVGDIQ